MVSSLTGKKRDILLLGLGLLIGLSLATLIFKRGKVQQDDVANAQEGQRRKSSLTGGDSSLGDPQRDIFGRIHRQMRREMEKMMEGGRPFQAGVSSLQITRDEDENYKYIRLHGKGIHPEDIKIKIEGEMISLSGQVKRVERGENSSSTSVSSFSQVFNIPSGVDAGDVSVEKGDRADEIVIKFKKTL